MLNLVLLGLVAACTALLGSIVFFQPRRQQANVHFALLSVGIAGWILSNALFTETMPEQTRFAIGLVSYGFAAFLALNFYLFCYDISEKRRHSLSVFLAYAIGTAAVVLSITPGVVSDGVEGLSMKTNTVGLLVYGAALLWLIGGGLLILISAAVNSKSRAQRSRILTVLTGLSIAAAIGVCFNLILPLLDNYSFVQYGPLGSVVLVAFCAYSMLRHGLFDIKLAAVRSIAYAFSLLALAAMYYVVAFVLSAALFREADDSSSGVSAISIVLALALAFFFQPVKRFFDQITDRIFYRNRYDTGDFLIRIGRILTSTTELRVVLDKVGSEIRQTLKADGSLFLVYRDQHSNELAGEGIERKFSADELTELYDNSATSQGSLIVVERLKLSDIPAERKLHTIFSERGVVLALPLISADETIGYFMLGEHLSGTYDQQDIDALEAIANELVIAVQNARSVQALRDLNAHLEQRIESATSELLSSNEKLRRLDAAKDEFVSMASHQLRTPLTSVKGYISMVLEGDAGKITPMQKKLLEEAFVSSERMVHLIGDFLNVSRLQTGKFVLDPSLINLADLVAEQVEGLKATAKSRTLKLDYRKPSRFPSLYLDGGKIHQVIMNFIDNAMYYSTENTTITIRLVVEEGEAVFEVHDTGIGVPKSEQAQLFTKFFRATNARRQRPDGTGIGLYLAKKVIDSHDGSMIFESVEGEGSTFGFRLPIKKLSEPPSLPSKTVE